MHRSISLTQRQKDRIELLQFTDTHIYPVPGETFDGVDTELTLQRVIAHARRNHRPDAILVTGDLVHEAAPAAYERLAAILTAMAGPVFCIPGNHDDPFLMRHHLRSGNLHTVSSLVFDRWIIVMLDTFLPDTHAGCLGDTELAYLDQVLTEHKDRHALICLHHPPLSVGSPWMDRMGLQNPADLFTITDRHPRVRGMLCGHIHQEFNGARNGVPILAAPSTCVQFTPHSGAYVRDDTAPGYRHLQLLDTGEIRSVVARIMNPIPGTAY